jgi:hypothetical protein
MRRHGVRVIVSFVAGAMAGIASVSQAQSPPVSGTWQELPNTKIRDVLPDPSGYPIDPLTAMALWNPVNIMDYSGGVQIPSEREVVVDGGGHHEYPGNEKYSVPYDGRPVSRIGMPSMYPVDGTSPETYADGRPAQRHTTDSMVFIPELNAIFKSGGGLWQGGISTAAAWLFHRGTLQDERLPDYPPGDYGAKSLYSVAKWHPELKKVIVRGRNHIALYDPFAQVWEEKARASWNESEMTGLLDTRRRRLVSIGHGRSEVWDLETWQPIYDSEDAKGPIPFSGPVFHDAFGPGFVYDEIGDRYIGWTWRNPSMLYSVNPDTWAVTAAPMAGTPPAELAWSSGTFGRFVRVSDPFDGVVVIPSVDSNAFKVVFDRQALPVADTVTILRAVFRDRRSVLIVQAVSSAAPAAELLVTVPGCVTRAPLEYKPSTGHYHFRTRDCQPFEGQVATVVSSFGGTAAKITEWRTERAR